MLSALKRIVEPVETRLEEFFEEVKAGPRRGLFRTHGDSNLLDQVRDLTLRGGKRVRAALLIEGAGLFDSEASVNPSIIDAAAALEIFHVYLLIHDDIMDGDATRRGGMSVHTALAKKARSIETGIGLGILAGDLAASLSHGILSAIDVPTERSLLAQQIFADMHFDVVCGQTLDMTANTPAIEVATHKTAGYTTIGPLTMGAALGGATPAEIEHLASMARPLGVAFQFADDLLGTFGDPKVTGKPTGGDLKTGKRTFLLEEGLRLGTAKQRKQIERALGKGDASKADVEAATRALSECGAEAACRTRIREMVVTFELELTTSGYVERRPEFLLALAKYIETRDR